MGMSSYVLDLETEFFEIANNKIGESDSLGQFLASMGQYFNMLTSTQDETEDMLGEFWNDFWSSKQ
jgi:hypothetical protein